MRPGMNRVHRLLEYQKRSCCGPDANGCLLHLAGVQRCVCQATHVGTDTSQQTTHSDKRQQMTRQEEVSAQPAPRSPFNTGSMDITTAGATASLCGHSIPAEKTIVILRHGMTTWNEEQRIQAKSSLLLNV